MLRGRGGRERFLIHSYNSATQNYSGKLAFLTLFNMVAPSHALIEHLKCDKSNLRCAIKYTLDFQRLSMKNI